MTDTQLAALFFLQVGVILLVVPDRRVAGHRRQASRRSSARWSRGSCSAHRCSAGCCRRLQAQLFPQPLAALPLRRQPARARAVHVLRRARVPARHHVPACAARRRRVDCRHRGALRARRAARARAVRARRLLHRTGQAVPRGAVRRRGDVDHRVPDAGPDHLRARHRRHGRRHARARRRRDERRRGLDHSRAGRRQLHRAARWLALAAAVGGRRLRPVVPCCWGARCSGASTPPPNGKAPWRPGCSASRSRPWRSAAWFTDVVGIHSVFGAFILGAAMPRGILTRELQRVLEPTTTALLVPLFFIYSGLNTRSAS